MSFDLTQTPDTKKSVLFDYPQTTVHNINLNDSEYLQCDFSTGGASSNIVYTESNVTSNFKSNQLRIYGVLFPKLVKTIEHTGTLVIKNTPTTNNPPNVYMCFLLRTNPIAVPTGIDNLMSPLANPNPSLYLNNLIKPETGTNQYIVYTGKDKNRNETTMIIYTSPISVAAQPFKSTASDWIGLVEPVSYSIVSKNSDGEWMECDYAPMDSDEVVTTYNIPIQSSVLKDSKTFDSFRTLIMFMVFLMLCIFSYLIIPSVYLAVIAKLLTAVGGNSISSGEKKTWILYIDIAISAVFGITGLILLCVGAFANPDEVKNTGDILLSGFIISIIFVISYIVIQSKKMTGKFIEGVKYDYL